MMTVKKEVLKLIPTLVRDDSNPTLKSFASIESEYTLNARGINVDYILLLKRKSNGTYKTERYPITKHYENVFTAIRDFNESCFVDDFNQIISYIGTTGLIQEATKIIKHIRQDSFNYCINLSDRYMPVIYINLENRLCSFQEKWQILEEVYKDQIDRLNNNHYKYANEKNADIDKLNGSYVESKRELKKELCNYIAIWLHAYRFMRVQSELVSQPTNKDFILLYSHRSHGWFTPSYRVNNDLVVGLNTNFGYGNSSFFYVTLIYKGIQIFPFLDWVNYKYAQASKLEKYSAKFPNEIENRRRHDAEPNSDLKKSSSIIKQKDWFNAFKFIEEASNLSDSSSTEFTNKYIIGALDQLINKLYEIIDVDVNKLNKEFRDFDYTFTINNNAECYAERIKLMDVKGSIISSTLDLIGQILKLEEIINTSHYIRKIEELNLKLLPILQDVIPYSQQLKDNLELEVKTLTNSLKEIWQDKGLKEYKLNKHTEKSRFEKKEIYFESLEKDHLSLSLRKKEAEQDLAHSIKLLKSIRSYVRNIENYFAKT